MTAAALLAFGAVSALGDQGEAVTAGEAGAPARSALAVDAVLTQAGLARPFAGRAAGLPPESCRATALLGRALHACCVELDVVRVGWRRQRVGLVLGTSSGSLGELERKLHVASPADGLEAFAYYGPVARASRGLGLEVDPALLVLGACASSTLAVGLAMRLLAQDRCDLVLAGGFDDVSVFVASGFEALRAIAASLPLRPFGVGRDGMALGEGAAVLALERCAGQAARAYLTGFGAASDAAHLTAPDERGSGLASAARAALAEAGSPPVDLVSAHATATWMNDAAEQNALTQVLGAPTAGSVPVHAFKAQIGHALGAGGALELLASIDALARGVIPATAGGAACDPATPVTLLERAERATLETSLKLSAAFGGSNAALVASRSPPLPLPRAKSFAFVLQGVHVNEEAPAEWIASRSRLSVDRVARGDGLVRFGLSAVAALAARYGPLDGAGIVVGTAVATLETNALFAGRLRARGARAVQPRVFPYTSPNAVVGECSIAYRLTGPSFAVGGGLHAGVEALASAALLVEAGDAERMVVVAADAPGVAASRLGVREVPAGAVAVLVASEAGWAEMRRGRDPTRRATAAQMACGRIVETSVRRGGEVHVVIAAGCSALLPLTTAPFPSEVVSTSPPDVRARVVLKPV